MNAFESHYYKINKLALCTIGQWVYQKTIIKILGKTLALTSLTTSLFAQFYCLISVLDDSDAIFECLTPMFLVLLCICQFGIYTLKQDKLRILVKHMEDDWNFWSSKVEREILEITARRGNQFTILYAINMYGSVIAFISMSMTPIVLDYVIPINETRPRQFYVYAAKYPVDEEKYYSWLLAYGSFTSLINLTVMFSCESMFAVTTQHVCGLFEIVGYQLRSAMKCANMEKKDKVVTDTPYEKVSSAIKWHNHALEYSNILNNCFSPFLFCAVGINVIAISALLIQTISSLDRFDQTIKAGIFASACMVHFFCLTLPAQNLLDSSMKVSRETYDGDWYNLSLEVQRLIVPLLLRSQKPSTLTVGKFCDMDLITFSELFKTSISYFTVLLSVREM